MPGVSVTATNLETNVVAVAETNAVGNYQLLYLIPGTYRISVEFQGFKKFERTSVEVRVGDVITIDIALEPGAITESVTITAETPLLESSSVTVGQVVDRRRLQDLPLAGSNPLYLLQLTPGIIATNSSAHGWFPHALDAITNVAASGSRTRATQFNLDGNPSMTRNGQVTYSPPPEMVQEMKVQSAPFDASQGAFSGANINIVTKSGGNQLHGDLWFSHYSRPLMTRNFFVNKFIFDPNTGPITEAKKKSQWPPTRTNRYRATISGPVIPNRTFFVFGWDKLDRVRAQTGLNTVPTTAQREGDFSELLRLGNQYQIYDPMTTASAANGRFSRQPLAGNIIPASRIDPIARRLLEFYPQPNSFGNAEGRNNFVAPIGSKIDYHSYSVRLDHTFSERHKLFGSFSWSNLDEPAQRRFPGSIARGQVEHRRHRGFALDDVYIISPTTVLNIRYGLTRYVNQLYPDSIGYDLSSLGFTSGLLNQFDAGLVALPQVEIQGLLALSQNSGRDSATNYHTLTGSLSQTRGNHSLRYGAEFRTYQDNLAQYGNYFPRMDFQTNWTRGPVDNSPAAPIGQGLASLLFGLPTGGFKDNNATSAMQSRYIGLFLQDDWKVTSRLTLNLGLRYELELPTTERYNRTVRGFDFTTTNPVEQQVRANYALNPIPQVAPDQFRVLGGLMFAGVGGAPRGLWNTDRNNFSPRFGLAYQLNQQTVLRAGYGFFYEQMGANYNSVIQQGFSQRTNMVPSLDNGLSFRATLSDPFPEGFLQPAGAAGGLRTFLGLSPTYFDPNRRTGYMQRWTLGVQRELPWRVLLETSYVGNRGTKLGMTRDWSAMPGEYLSSSPFRDQPTINALTRNVPNPYFGIPEFAGTGLAGRNVQVQRLLSPFSQYGTLTTTESTGYSWYHSLQMRVDKRLAKGFTIQGTYTWSKFMEAVQRLNAFDPMPHEVISPQDRPQHIAISGVYELPFGRGRKFLSGIQGVTDHFLGGWSVQGIYQGQSGAPLNWGNIAFYGNIKDITLPKSQRTPDRWFNIDAGFQRTPALQLASNVRTFPLRLNDLRQDGFNQFDLSAFKTIRLTERLRLQLRAEAQNALNHAPFNAPNLSPTNSLFGQVTATQFAEQRRITVAAKVSW